MGAGNICVDCVKLDSVLKNEPPTYLKPTYIKMDIEGAELDAIRGRA